MKWIFCIVFGITSNIAFAQTISITKIEELSALVQLSTSAVDSVLMAKGFKISGAQGLKFIYKKNNELIVFQGNPREVRYEPANATDYFKLSSQIGSDFVMVNESDSISIDANREPFVSFESNKIKYSFATLSQNSKPTRYIIVVAPIQGKDIQKTTPKPKSESDFLMQTLKPISETIVRPKETDNKSEGGFQSKKNIFTFGIGLYNLPGYSKNDGVVKETTGATEYALNLGFEIAKTNTMQLKKRFYTNTRFDINYTSFKNIQVAYFNMYDKTLSVMYVGKHYFTFGALSEIRHKNESLLLSFCMGLNWNRGKVEGMDPVNQLVNVGQMGEYYQHNFRSSTKNKDNAFLRMGFEQFYSTKSGYIGQFVLTLGI